MDTLLQDAKFALRMFLKNPGFTLIAVLTLSLGIGVNTAIFSIVNAVLLNPLPYDHAERIQQIWDNNLQRGAQDLLVSYPRFTEWKEQTGSFDAISAYTIRSFSLKGQGEPEQVQGARVSTDFFQVMGVKPMLGRTFLPDEDAPGGNQVVVLSYELWQSNFGASESIIDQTLILDAKITTVIGVLPADFHFPDEATMLWVPRVFDAPTPAPERIKIGAGFLAVIARLKPDVPASQARAEVEAINDRYRQHYVGNMDVDNGSKLVSLQEQIVGDIKPTLLILQGAVVFVLLIACANVANLFLARSSGRQKELAIRKALGASRLRLIRQLLAENILLSLVGAAFGLLLAMLAIKLLVAINPGNIPCVKEVWLDGAVLLFTLTIAVLTGVIVGLVPALYGSNVNLNDNLKESGRSSTPGLNRHRLRSLIVVTEVALALTLLISAGLLIQSFIRLRNVNPGFEPDNVLTMQISLPRSKYTDPASQSNFFKQLIQRVEELPGVQSAGAVSYLPLSGGGIRFFYNIEGRPRLGLGKDPVISVRSISPDYFQALGIPLLRGRAFTDQDTSGNPKVVIISDTMARRSFAGEDPIGKRLAISSNYGPDGWMTIVAIAGDVKHTGLEAESSEELYMPYLQTPWPSMYVVARTAANPASLSGAVRNEVFFVDKDQPVFNMKTMTEVISSSVTQPRFTVFLLGSFAGVALLLAALGIYGVMAYSVTQRTQEMGIRMALGANRASILKLVMRQGMILALIGILIGVGAAFFATRVMKSLLFGIGITDPITFVSVPLILIVVALLACYIPARKATRVDPVIALRYE
ncbi:MAG: ABC transporter permease [Blastocatellia bacterium]